MINIKALLTLGTSGVDKAAAAFSKVNTKLGEAADNAERMNRAANAKVSDRAGDTKRYRTQRSIAGTRGAEGRNFAGLASMAEGGVDGSFVGAYASLAANIFAVTAAFQALSNAARTEQLTKGLELMGARGGVALTQTAKNLQTVTDNALSAADAMRATAQASSAGFSGDEIARLGQVARGASLALGRDMSDSLDRLTKGAIKLEPELLDELGIMTRLDDAVKVYAEANGKAVSALTQTERRQAFLNAVLEEGERKFGDINEQIATNPFDQLSASVRDTATQIGILANNVLGPVAKFFAENPFALLAPGIFLITKALEGLGITATLTQGKVNNLFTDMVEGSKTKNFRFDLQGAEVGQAKSSGGDIAKFVKTSVLTSSDQIESLDDLKNSFRNAEIEAKKLTGTLSLTDKAQIAASKSSLILSIRMKLVGAAIASVAKSVAIASVQMLAFTALFAALALAGSGISKLTDYFRGLTPEMKESRNRMKELADQAEETAKQIRLMTAPGKEQQGLAFDAVANSLKAAAEERENYNKILERSNELEKEAPKGIERAVFNVGKTRALSEEEGKQVRSDIGAPGMLVKASTATMNEKEIFESLEDGVRRRLNLSKEDAKLQVASYKMLLAQLPVNEYINKLKTTDVDSMIESLSTSEKAKAVFKDIAESGKNITKSTKDLFPKKTVTAASEVAQGFKEILTSIEAGPKEGETLELFKKGVASSAADLAPTIRDNVISLKAQGVELKDHQKTLDLMKNLEDARGKLSKALLNNNVEAEKNAKTQVDNAQAALAAELDGIVALYTTIEIEQRILGVVQAINQEKLKILGIESQIAKQSGDTAKSALEYEQTIKDSKRLEAGLDLNIPEELTIEYRLKIAEIEKNTAAEVARIKKDTLTLEAEQQKILIGAEIARLQEAASTKPRLTGIPDAGLAVLARSNTALREVALTEQQIRLQEDLLALQDKLLGVGLAGADAESLKAKGAFKTLEAQKKGLNPAKLAAKYALEELDALQEKQAILSANADSLSMGAELSKQVTSLLKATELPALQQKLAIAKQNVIEQENYIKDNKNLSADLLAFNQRELKARQDKEASINAQIDGINQIVDSATAGNIAEAASLDIQDKKLGILRDQANAMKGLKDAQLNLNRAQAEARATTQGRELSASEQGALKANELKSQIESIIGPSTKEQGLSEMDLLEQERDLLIKRSELEEALFTIRLAAAEQELKNAIDLAPAGSDTSKAKSALATLQSLDFKSVFAEERAAILSNKELEKQTLQARADALKAELSAIPTTAAEVGNQILLGLSNELRGAFSGFGLTGQGADFFASESAAVKNSGMSIEFQEKEIALIRKKAFEIQDLQILTEGLNGIFSNLTSGIEGAFMAMIDGSKSAKQAFGEMAVAILRDIAAMTIKMLIFKAIQTGFNMLFPAPTPNPAVSFTDMRGYADGGIIGLANGGIMDARGGVQGIVSKPTYLVGEGRYNEAVVPLPNGRAIPVQMHGGGSQSNNVAVTVNMTNNGSQTQTEGPDANKMGQAIAAAVQRELVAQKAPGGLLNRYSAI